MVVTALSRPGQNNGAGDDNALFLRKFSGEVLAQFKAATQFAGLTQTRTLSGAKSALFPVLGDATSTYHTAGESIYGTDNGQTSTYLNNIKSKEREIFADDPAVAPTFVANIDELKTYWEVRSRYATELGNALAQRLDYQVLSTIFAAAKADTDFAGFTGANKSLTVSGNSAAVGANLVTTAWTMAELFDNMNVPKDGRILVVRPKQYYLLSKEKDLLDRDYVQSNGDYSRAEILRVAGMRIVVTNNMPTTSTASGKPWNYAATYGGVRNHVHGGSSGYTMAQNAAVGAKTSWATLGMLAFHPAATGTVKMAEVSSEMERSIERQGTLLLSKYVMGHNILRPECAIAAFADTI